MMDKINKNTRIKLFIFTVIFFGFIASLNAETITRRRLTFRDWGMYCGPLYHVPKDKQPEGWKYYDPYFIMNDSPWDFFIIQVNTYQGKGAEKANDELRTLIDGLNKKEKLPILRVLLFEKSKKAESVEVYQKKLDYLFNNIDVNKIYAITLDEENIYWNGYSDVLDLLYDYVKAKYPELVVYQFYTPMVTPDKHATKGWRALRADGWISDVYCMIGDMFEKHIVRHLDLDVSEPVIHIVWASPAWPFGKTAKGADPRTWWLEHGGKEQFDFQMKICREYNIPVAFFATQRGTPFHGLYWAWASTDPQTQNMYTELCGKALQADIIPETQIGFRKINPKIIAWAETKPASGNKTSKLLPVEWRFDVDHEGNAVVEVKNKLDFKGKTKLERKNNLFSISCDIIKGAELLEKPITKLRLRGHKDKSDLVEVVCEINWKKTPLSFEFSIEGTGVKALGGVVSAEFSKDGQSWKSKDRKKGESAITISSTDVYGRRLPIEQNTLIKLILQNRSGLNTGVGASLSSVNVKLTYSKDAFSISSIE